jgi:hypothetical protein
MSSGKLRFSQHGTKERFWTRRGVGFSAGDGKSTLVVPFNLGRMKGKFCGHMFENNEILQVQLRELSLTMVSKPGPYDREA